jgi:iron complex outermembrane recepter protein
MTRSRKRKLMRSRAALASIPLVSAALAGSPVAMAQQASDLAILEEVVVTAQKRVESLQNVPLSIQAINAKRLEELHVTSFSDYVKFLPSVSTQNAGPGFGLAYFRGVASGENANHSTSQPTVGMYLDEQPITTIQGALDIHIYDIARVEALAGPQGTLYGASSEAGTIRIITNKPDASGFKAGYDLEVNTIAKGGTGYVAEGFLNLPISDAAAIRVVGWYQHDGGYIDNVEGTRTFPTSGGCISNAQSPPPGCIGTTTRAKNDYNEVDTYGARAALKIDLNESWSITPVLMGQEQKVKGSFAFAPNVGDLKLTHFYPDDSVDHWIDAALTVEGKIGNFDLVYTGAFLKRNDITNSDYSDYSYFYDVVGGSGAYWYDSSGTPLPNPSQYINGKDGYKKQSHEFRFSSPQDHPFRVVAGLFFQKQEHEIFQRYKIDGLDPAISVPLWPNTIWLTNQKRIDRDQALFAEMTYDITSKISALAGVRVYKYKNSLKGFFGYGAGYSSNYGEALCFSPEQFKGSPCVNLDDEVDKSGAVPKFTFTYRFDNDRLMYATVSKGFRPGGINRNGTVPPFKPDFLTNYEVGWKSTWFDGRLRFNGAVFVEQWKDIQFSFLPPSGSGLTVVKNAGDGKIKGIEADFQWAASRAVTLGGGLSIINAKLSTDYIPYPADPPTAFSGTTLPVSPKFKANLTGRYAFKLGGFDAHAQAAVVHQGQSWADLQDSDRSALGPQHAYTTVDLSTGIEKGSYSVQLYVNNATDERGETFKFAQCATDVCGANPYIVPNRPRAIGIKFGQKF